MLVTPDAVRDPTRLAALADYEILDTVPETGFDDIVRLGARLCATPVALVSLVAADRQYVDALRMNEFAAVQTEIVRTTRSLVFVRGVMKVADRTIATADGVWKRLALRAAS